MYATKLKDFAMTTETMFFFKINRDISRIFFCPSSTYLYFFLKLLVNSLAYPNLLLLLLVNSCSPCLPGFLKSIVFHNLNRARSCYVLDNLTEKSTMLCPYCWYLKLYQLCAHACFYH